MIRHRNRKRRDAERSNLPWRHILYLVLSIIVIEVVHVLTIEESIYAQDVPALAATSEASAQTGPMQTSPMQRTALTDDSVDSSIRIVALYGPNSVRAGEVVNYRVRLADGAKRPVIYRWNMGDGTLAEGNNVTHRFSRPGHYEIVATAQNRAGSDTKSIRVVVTGHVIIPVPETDEAARADRSERSGGETPKVTKAADPAPISSRDAGFRGPRPLSWSSEHFTLLVSTSSDRVQAEQAAVDLRRRGLRSGIYLDDTGIGTPVYRVVVGEFAGEAEAVRGRQVLLAEGHPGAFIVHPMPQQ